MRFEDLPPGASPRPPSDASQKRSAMKPEARIEHRYPEVLDFVRRHGPDALMVLHHLLAHAQVRDHHLVAQASTRQIASELKVLSKDSVHRRLRQLHSAQVIRLAPTTATAFEAPTYVVDLTGTGIAVTSHRPASPERPPLDPVEEADLATVVSTRNRRVHTREQVVALTARVTTLKGADAGRAARRSSSTRSRFCGRQPRCGPDFRPGPRPTTSGTTSPLS